MLELLQTVIMEEGEEGDKEEEDTAWGEVFSRLDRAPRLSVRIDIWILLSDYLQIVRRQCCPLQVGQGGREGGREDQVRRLHRVD